MFRLNAQAISFQVNYGKKRSNKTQYFVLTLITLCFVYKVRIFGAFHKSKAEEDQLIYKSMKEVYYISYWATILAVDKMSTNWKKNLSSKGEKHKI